MTIAVNRTGVPFWRRGMAGLAAIILHALALAGLLVVRLIDERLVTSPPPSSLTLVSLPPIPVPPRSSRRRSHKSEGEAPVIDQKWFERLGRFGRNAITIRIPKYHADGPPVCPSPLKPGSPEWRRRCPWLAEEERKQQQVEPEEPGYEDFSLVPRDAPAFKRWENEQKKRNAPVQAPCTYVRRDPATGQMSTMTDVGCAARKLLGR